MSLFFPDPDPRYADWPDGRLLEEVAGCFAASRRADDAMDLRGQRLFREFYARHARHAYKVVRGIIRWSESEAGSVAQEAILRVYQARARILETPLKVLSATARHLAISRYRSLSRERRVMAAAPAGGAEPLDALSPGPAPDEELEGRSVRDLIDRWLAEHALGAGARPEVEPSAEQIAGQKTLAGYCDTYLFYCRHLDDFTPAEAVSLLGYEVAYLRQRLAAAGLELPAVPLDGKFNANWANQRVDRVRRRLREFLSAQGVDYTAGRTS
jgi:DNA-directed RNA polymerase specialized sigma24 family protein